MDVKIDHTVIEARRHISQQDLEQEFEIVQVAERVAERVAEELCCDTKTATRTE